MKHLFSFLMIASVLTACNSGARKAAEIQAAKQKTIDSLNIEIAKQRVIDSMKTVRIKAEKQNAQHVQNSGSYATSNSTPAKKKGWSHTAKGALVGAGTGAVTGAIINHNNRAGGAVIGTLIGAGVGAGTGLIVDNSVKKKKKKKAQSQQ